MKSIGTKATGIVRKLDELNRLVIPKEMCRAMGIDKGGPMEIFVDNGTIILKPYHAADEITNLAIRIKDRLKSDGYSDKTLSAGMDKIGELIQIVKEDKP